MRKVPLVLVALLALSAGAIHGQLFAPVERELAATPASTLPLMKTLEVAVDHGVLSAEVFDLELDGSRFTAKGRLQRVSEEHQVWSGTLEDDAGGEGSMVLTRYREGTWGQIDVPAGTWVVETRGGHTYLHTFNPTGATTKECGVLDSRPAALEAAASSSEELAEPTTANDSVIEVQFWYTRERLAEVGSVEDLRGLTLAQLDITNEALAKTGAGLLPFRLAYLLPAPEPHVESGDIWTEMRWFVTNATVKRWRELSHVAFNHTSRRTGTSHPKPRARSCRPC